MPMDGGRLRQSVRDVDAYPVAFDRLDHRSGGLSVVAELRTFVPERNVVAPGYAQRSRTMKPFLAYGAVRDDSAATATRSRK